MKKKHIPILIVLLCISFHIQAQRVFFVDSEKGNDSNHGMDSKTAWKSLEKINSFDFQPGDQLLLKRGQVFPGQIHLKSTEKINLHLRLGAYGTGRRPVINATGKDCAIKLMDSGNFEIADIETSGGENAGIFVGCTQNGLELNQIRITNCYVHDIGDTTSLDWDYSTSTGGIIVSNANFGKDGKPQFFNSVFNNVIIDGCSVCNNSRWTCISITSGKKDSVYGDSNIIKNCTAEFSVADGIRMNGVKNSRIEYCVMYRNGSWPKITGRNLGGLGAWFFDAGNCTIQYCEAGYVGANTSDGGAFDIDYRQKNSTVQYCYGHDCAGYGVSIFGADPTFPTENSVVRFNILRNNGQDSTFVFQGDFFIYTWSGGLLNGVTVHDNLSIWNPVVPGASLKFDANFTGNKSNTFTNNIIYAKKPWLASFSSDSLFCENNTYWVASSGNSGESNQAMWTKKNTSFNSLKEWQNATGHDVNSKYEEVLFKIPAWYKADIQGITFRKNDNNSILYSGAIAPKISGETINGQKVNFADYTGNLILLSFINSGSLTSQKTSIVRSQLAFLKSMKRQYEGKGLKVILIDESGQIDPGNFSHDDYLNFIADEAEDMPVLLDGPNTGIAVKYGVETVPATFLISGNGIIIGCWENLSLPAQLAFSIENGLKEQQKN